MEGLDHGRSEEQLEHEPRRHERVVGRLEPRSQQFVAGRRREREPECVFVGLVRLLAERQLVRLELRQRNARLVLERTVQPQRIIEQFVVTW